MFQIELAQHLVVRRHFPLALEHTDRHRRLVVLCGREDLALVRRNGCVAVDQAGEHATQRFNPERQRGHIEQHHILDITLKHTGLNGGTHGNHLIGVHTLMRLFAKELGHFLDHARHAGHTANKDHLVDIRRCQASILERGLAGLERGGDEIPNQAFKLGAGQFDDHVQRLAVRPHRYERLVDFRLRRAGQLDLGLFCRFL